MHLVGFIIRILLGNIELMEYNMRKELGTHNCNLNSIL